VLRVLFLPKYSQRAASSRYRTYQYLPYLKEQGFACEVYPLFSTNYIRRIYEGEGLSRKGRLYLEYFTAFVKRIRDILRARRYDLVVFEKELYPYSPFILEPWLRSVNPHLVVDYDDAIFATYEKSGTSLIRWLLGRKIGRVIASCKAVIVGNGYLRQYALRHNDNVHLIPTAIDLRTYEGRKEVRKAPGQTVIGWIGTPITAQYLTRVQEALSVVAREYEVILKVVGAPHFRLASIPMEARAWSLDTEVSDIFSFDIGIMPVPDDEWAKGKCGLKLVQYMAASLPSVATPVGANTEIIQDGVNGFLANNTEDWIQRLSLLIEDESLRHRLGRNARVTVEERYSLRINAPRLKQALEQAAGRG